MRDIQLFQQALGLSRPWFVVRSEFRAEDRRLEVYLDFERGATFPCPECGQEGCKAHDTVEKSWRHLNFFQHEAYLHARVPRVRCAACGVRLVGVPWARPGSGFTLLFEALTLMLAKAMPMRALSRLVGEHDTRLWRTVHYHVDEARAETHFMDVRCVGVDETASKRGHNYISLFVDLEEAKLLFATEGRKAETVAEFREELEAHGGVVEQIEEFSLDMSPAFIKGIETSFPEASLTFDKFHVMSLLGTAVEQVRREERKTRPELKGSRYVWTKNPENLTPKQFGLWSALDVPSLNLKTARAYHIRLNFQEIWSLKAEAAKAFFDQWYFWATHSRLEPIIKTAKTLRAHWEGVARWFESGISNAVLEAINSLVQAAKSRARGYRSNRNLIAMAYLLAGKLKFRTLPT